MLAGRLSGDRVLSQRKMASALIMLSMIVGSAGVPTRLTAELHHSGAALQKANHSALELVRREADGSRDPADIRKDGAVQVVSPAQTKSEQLKLEELTEECMQEHPTSECMEKYGSYGVRKLYTETWDNVKKLGFRREGWMSHPEVQKKKIFELTLPGTINSGTYAITGEDAAAAGMSQYGVVSQNLDFYQQLELGVRLFDMKVAYSPETNLVYLSHGALMVPLATALKDMRRFLEEHTREIIVIDMNKDANADTSHLQPLVDEENTMDRIPGQLALEAVECEMKEMLATYKTLDKLSAKETPENPSVASLTDLGINVLLFWNSQQVLCTKFEECKLTPGWHPGDKAAGFEFAFGPPYEVGKRRNVTGGRLTARIIEPLCLTHSKSYTKDDQPERMVQKITTFAQDMAAKAKESRPKCFPVSAPFPETHTPTLWYTVDAYVIEEAGEQAVQQDRMRGVKAIYTRGEGYTAKTDAERTNYLLLSWFCKKNNQELFMRPNGFMVEFAGSAYMPIIRMIEAEQNRPECGWAVYCKASGSCWADTLLSKEDSCLDEAEVVAKLKEHAEQAEADVSWAVFITVAVVSCIFCCCIFGAFTKMTMIMAPKNPKEADESFIAKSADDGDKQSSVPESSLPGSSAASDFGDRPEDLEPRFEGSQPAASSLAAP